MRVAILLIPYKNERNELKMKIKNKGERMKKKRIQKNGMNKVLQKENWLLKLNFYTWRL